jgi:hypothetical protein
MTPLLRRGRAAIQALALLVSAALAAALCFRVLEQQGRMVLLLDMELGIPAPATGQVFWDMRTPGAEEAEGDRFSEKATRWFEVRPGRGVYALDVPLDLRSLRIDPMVGPGSIAFHRIALFSNRIPIRRWDARRGFNDWQAVSDLENVKVADGSLRMESRGPDPFLVARGLSTLRPHRRRINLALAAGAALLWLAVQATLVLTAARAGAPVPAAATPASRLTFRGLPATLLLGAASTVFSVAVGYVLYRAFVAPSAPAATPLAFAPDYEPTVVDRSGRALSTKRGGLKVVLDPFTLYRNLPGQRTSRFTIDAYGWRGGLDESSPRPRAVVLGGSAAFGLGLDSDADTFVAQLNGGDVGYHFVNAAVVGFLSGQELAEMVHYADRLRPRLYVAFDGWNEMLQYVDLQRHGAAGALGYNGHIFATVEERLRRHAAEDTPPGGEPEVSATPSPGWSPDEIRRRILAAYTDNLARMAAFARAREARFVVVFQPHLGGKRRRAASEVEAWRSWESTYVAAHPTFVADYDALLEGARAFCSSRGIAYLDLSRSPAINDDDQALFLDAVHPNRAGHQRVAELVGARLRESTAGSSPGSR